jgi:hypothetical protein
MTDWVNIVTATWHLDQIKANGVFLCEETQWRENKNAERAVTISIINI